MIAPQPEHLLGVVGVREWLRGSGHSAALVTDSYWVERIPRMVGRYGHFDQIFIHDAELVDDWHSKTGLPVGCVPVGSDVLGHGTGESVRPVDVLRVGRQPAAWDDDDRLIQAAKLLGLEAAGRPPMYDDAGVGYRELMKATSRAKATLAFTNKVNPTPYTHPTREWLSYRWVDAIATGTVVAGVPPKCQAASDLLWPEALLEVSPVDMKDGLRVIAEWTERWTPGIPRALHQRALMTLDWRWRLKTIAQEMDLTAPLLDSELGAIERMAI